MSLVIQKFNECLKKCEEKNVTLKDHFLNAVKDCQRQYEYVQKDNEKLIDCIDTAVKQKTPIPVMELDICLNNCKFDSVRDTKYWLAVTKGVRKAKKRRDQGKIQDLIDDEADFFLGLLVQLRDRIEEDTEDKEEATKQVLAEFNGNYDKWYKTACCAEIAFNAIAGKVGFDDIPTHGNNLEDTLMKTEAGQRMGRDSVVKAIYRTMKARLALNYQSDLDKIKLTEEPAFESGSWSSDFQTSHPFTDERLYVRERHTLGQHADGTEDWRYDYYIDPDLDEMQGVLGHRQNGGYGTGLLDEEQDSYSWDILLDQHNIWVSDMLSEIEHVVCESGGPHGYVDDFYFWDTEKTTYQEVAGKLHNLIIVKMFEEYHAAAIPFAQLENAGTEELKKLTDWLAERTREKLEKKSEKFHTLEQDEIERLSKMTVEEKDAEQRLRYYKEKGLIKPLNDYFKETK